MLIASLTPYFLEKEFFWYEENLKTILDCQKTQTFWQENTLFLEKDQSIALSELLRKIDELGYEKVFTVRDPGEFSQKGGLLEIFPINTPFAVRLDFLGNQIDVIEKLPLEIQDEQKTKAILKKRLKSQKAFSDLKNLKPGDYLVHLDHGIGRFLGLEKKEGGSLLPFELRKERTSFLSFYTIEYAIGDRLYVPVGLERKLSRYIGFIDPKLSRLGSSLWQKTKQKIKEDAEKFAKELLAMFAQKEVALRPVYTQKEIFEKLEETFAFDLTPDQKQTLEEIEQDLSQTKPMDRIVCGDVGFGKTEIALRVAALCCENNKQTALICPTTILASQHFQTFQKRLSGLPFQIEILTRLQNAREQKRIIQDLKTGKTDMVIATHRILGKDIQFKNLGLLIIDDEQRFGVKQKEKLRAQNPSLDILYLSATPIPRTLYLALSSLKETSLIQTPPLGRKAIQTFVLPLKKEIVKKAIEAELKRKGQIYFLHNRISSLFAMKKHLEEIVPQARIGILHAKLPEKELIQTMHDFQNKKIDLLISTTIIENGLDIANANTLIVDDATRLGLSQAYQIRGRIGRSHHQAFAYFLYPPKSFKGLAKKRLLALKEAQELGVGYQIALRDMEIRGAGNILGREQSGSANKIGLNLYCQILSEAVEKLKGSL